MSLVPPVDSSGSVAASTHNFFVVSSQAHFGQWLNAGGSDGASDWAESRLSSYQSMHAAGEGPIGEGTYGKVWKYQDKRAVGSESSIRALKQLIMNRGGEFRTGGAAGSGVGGPAAPAGAVSGPVLVQQTENNNVTGGGVAAAGGARGLLAGPASGMSLPGGAGGAASVAVSRGLSKMQAEGFPLNAIREIRVLKKMVHPNIVRLYDVCVALPGPADFSAQVFLVFEFVEHDLSGLLRHKNARRTKVFSPGVETGRTFRYS